MASLDTKIQAQKEIIIKGGWRKWGAYLILAALTIMGIAVYLIQEFFLRKRLAQAKTDAAIAEEALEQDIVDDEIEDLEEESQEIEERIARIDKQLEGIRKEDAIRSARYERDKEIIEELNSWEELDIKVEWDDENLK